MNNAYKMKKRFLRIFYAIVTWPDHHGAFLDLSQNFNFLKNYDMTYNYNNYNKFVTINII